MKRTVLLFVAVLMIIMCFSSCDKIQTSDNWYTLEDYIRIKGTVTVSYFGSETERFESSLNPFIEAFIKAYPKSNVKKDLSSDSVLDERLSSGDIGDVICFPESQAYELAGPKRVLMPLDGYFQVFGSDIFGFDTDDVYRGIYNSGKCNGKFYYAALNFSQGILAYNSDAVEGKGLSAAVQSGWTWQQFLDICGELTDEEHYGGKIDLSYAPFVIPFLNAYSGENSWYSLDDKTVNLTGSDSRRALEEAVLAHNSGYINIVDEAGQELFAGKTPVFTALLYSDIQNYGDASDLNGTGWDMINMPLFPCPTFGTDSYGFGCFNRTRNPDAAAYFVLFVYTQVGQKALNSSSERSIPPLQSLTNEDFWKHPDDNWCEKNWDANVYKAQEYGTVGHFECILPPEIADLFSQNELARILQDAVNGTRTLSDSFAETEEKANLIWKELS